MSIQDSRERTLLMWFVKKAPYRLICFKLGIKENSTILYSLFPVWMTLTFTQSHRVSGELELVQSFCCKVSWRNQNVCDGWSYMGDGWTKSWKHSEYESFEHLLLLLVVVRSLQYLIHTSKHQGPMKTQKLIQACPWYTQSNKHPSPPPIPTHTCTHRWQKSLLMKQQRPCLFSLSSHTSDNIFPRYSHHKTELIKPANQPTNLQTTVRTQTLQ